MRIFQRIGNWFQKGYKPISTEKTLMVDDVVLERIIENKVFEVLNKSREKVEELNDTSYIG